MAKAKGPVRYAAEKAARQANQRAADFGEATGGRVSRKVLDRDIAHIRAAGGNKAVQAAKDLVARERTPIVRGMGNAGRASGKLFNRVNERLESAMNGKVISERRWDRLVKAGARGLFSPAALAEGVAGSAAKAATHEKFKREARAESKPTKGGMKRVKTKA